MSQIDTLSDSGDVSFDSNGLQPPQALSNHSSPIKSLPNNKTLRRKRSSANAALTSRPSLLNLRDGRVPISKAQLSPTLNGKVIQAANLLGLTPSSPSTLTPSMNLDEGMELHQSLTALTLGNPTVGSLPGYSESIFSSSATESDISATFSDVSMSRRPSWDVDEVNEFKMSISEGIDRNRLILAHVITTYDQNGSIQSESLGHALITPNILITHVGHIVPVQDLNNWTNLRATVEQSRIVAMCSDEAKRTFEMLGGQTTKHISTFYLQSEGGKSEGKLSKIIVHGLEGKNQDKFDEARLEALPQQLRALIRQSSEIVEYSKLVNPTADQEAKFSNALLTVDFAKSNLVERRQEFAMRMHFIPDVTLIKREYKECNKIACSLDKHCTSALAKKYNDSCIGCYNKMCYDSSKQMAKQKSFKKGSSSKKKEKGQSSKGKSGTSN
ncbi:uncharacterized protein FA14DRAFT_179609 [Meira miltonrushii]|uniref:Uncharacterized protein n=1 Tax=Meira miltonrushii TaxID=1280837 RepID=A0A316VGT7_9BASI|nr:uncharacterized protein FA14DRAFT_179609 [Meira miltonrushii]PWN36248.1 hypothetical protein FA14DRAFT_179609 [Meira miltonrushii]